MKRLLGHGSEDAPGRVQRKASSHDHQPTAERAPIVDHERTVILFRKSQRFDSVPTLGAYSPDLSSVRLITLEARVEGDLDDTNHPDRTILTDA